MAKPKVCELLTGYDAPENTPSFSNQGNCQDPEAFKLYGMLPNGYAWVDGHLSETTVPWASWDIDKGQGRKERPAFCTLDLGPVIDGAVHVRCKSNPYFTTFYVILQGSSGAHRFDTQWAGTIDAEVTIKALQIKLIGSENKTLVDVAQGNPARQARLIQEVFNSPDWSSSILVAPVYTAPNDPHPPTWHDEL